MTGVANRFQRATGSATVYGCRLSFARSGRWSDAPLGTTVNPLELSSRASDIQNREDVPEHQLEPRKKHQTPGTREGLWRTDRCKDGYRALTRVDEHGHL